MTLHLNVIHDVSGEDGVNISARIFNPARYDFYWNKDFTAFRPIQLKWWDDESYARYQAGDAFAEAEALYAEEEANKAWEEQQKDPFRAVCAYLDGPNCNFYDPIPF